MNDLFALGARPRRDLRAQLHQLLRASAPDDVVDTLTRWLSPAADCTLHMPSRVGDYTDFYAGVHHARRVGTYFRPDNPLLPNYKWIPIGYHGRASSVAVSGTPVRRPVGQRKNPQLEVPTVGPSERLDLELELGVWTSSSPTPGTPVPISRAAEHIAGFCLLNDWSARDIQTWEYQPLGPFLAKSFATTVSAYVVTPEALAPYRVALERPADDPQPLPYLHHCEDLAAGGLDIVLEVGLSTAAMRARGLPDHGLSRSSSTYLYWTAAQLVTHHSSGGCELQPGDLLGTGTISSPDDTGVGSMLELTTNGRNAVTLPTGETRTFLLDGDEITIRGRASRPGYAPIGFGECRARVVPL